jgi:hypothetical protein
MIKIIDQLLAKASKKPSKPNAWLDELAEMDDISALRFSTTQLAHIVNDENPDTQLQLDLLMQIEEINFSRLETLSTQYASYDNLKPDLANNISETCYNYCRQSYVSHLKVVEKVINPAKFKLAGTMPVFVVARAIYAAINMIQWRMYNQASPPTKVWLQIYMLYQIAHKQALLNIPIELFKLAPSTTLSAYFVQVCMLGQLGQASLQKQHVNIAMRVLSTWLTRAHISSKYTPEQYMFYIDLEKDAAAKRMRNFEPNEQCRYWELDEFEKLLTVAISVADRGEIPQNLKLSKIDNAHQLHETLSMMRLEWTRANYIRQRRKESRQAASRNAKVNAGILKICAQVQEANKIKSGLKEVRDNNAFDNRLMGHTVLRQPGSFAGSSFADTNTMLGNSGTLDTWIITDESSHGLGTRVNKFANILARVDKLVGIMMDDDPSKVIIGMIRAVKPTHGNQLKVGIEVVSHHPSWVQLKLVQSEEAFPSTQTEMSSKSDPILHSNFSTIATSVETGYFPGIYIPIEAGFTKASTLLLPKINYQPNANYSVQIHGESKHAKLGQPIESIDDWVKVVFPF